ncbi:MAG: DinB family protein [Anaerolineales bacterium]|nr:DinB family protein [Anaerolineales bacterium]
MDVEHKQWNDRQKKLRQLLKCPAEIESARSLILTQHSWVHRAEIAGGGFLSFADAVWQDLSPQAARCIPPGGEHSVLWCLYHLARIEDVTMSVLAAGMEQVFDQEGRQAALNSPIRHTANEMTIEEIESLSSKIDLDALASYRRAVGTNTRRIVQEFAAEDLERQVKPEDLQLLLDRGDVLPEAQPILDYWGRRTVAGLLLMPPTRHNLIHINEAMRIKKKAGRLNTRI